MKEMVINVNNAYESFKEYVNEADISDNMKTDLLLIAELITYQSLARGVAKISSKLLEKDEETEYQSLCKKYDDAILQEAKDLKKKSTFKVIRGKDNK